jgi:hypothetical protein
MASPASPAAVITEEVRPLRRSPAYLGQPEVAAGGA